MLKLPEAALAHEWARGDGPDELASFALKSAAANGWCLSNNARSHSAKAGAWRRRMSSERDLLSTNKKPHEP